MIDTGHDLNTIGGRYGSLLQAAIVGGHEDTITYLLRKKVNVNQLNGYYDSPLGAAAACGRADLVKELISMGAEVNVASPAARAPLCHACATGDLTTVQALVEHGAKIETTSWLGRPLIVLAAEAGNLDIIKFLLARRLSARRQDTHWADGEALRVAASVGHLGLVDLLLNENCPVDEASKWGSTALHEAAIAGHDEVVMTLLQRKASVCAEGYNGWNALLYGTRRLQPSTLKEMLKLGAQVNHSLSSGTTALHLACARGRLESARVLLDHGADLDAEDESCWTSLHTAVWAHHTDVVEALLEHQPNLAVMTHSSHTALDLAFKCDCSVSLKTLLIEACHTTTLGLDYQHPIRDQRRNLICEALQAASARDEAAILRLTSSEILDAQIANCLLELSMRHSMLTTARRMLSAGATPAMPNAERRTAIHVAARSNNAEMMKLLLDQGVNPAARDYAGLTALDHAAAAGKPALGQVEMLMREDVLARQYTNGRLDSPEATRLSAVLGNYSGIWEGSYKYRSWMKGREDKTAMTVDFNDEQKAAAFPRFRNDAEDEVGPFAIFGQVVAPRVIVWVKLYRAVGWHYHGELSEDKQVISGTWGHSSQRVYGTFTLRRSLVENGIAKASMA